VGEFCSAVACDVVQYSIVYRTNYTVDDMRRNGYSAPGAPWNSELTLGAKAFYVQRKQAIPHHPNDPKV